MAPVAVSSNVVWSEMVLIVGASFTAVTVSTSERVALAPPASVTVTVIVLVPLALATGLSVSVRLAPLPPRVMPSAVTTPRFDDVAVTDPTAVSTSPTVKAMAPVAVSSNVVWSEMALIVGASFTAVTVSTNERVAVAPPASVTVAVIVLVPLALATGVSVIVRSLLGPCTS